MGLLSRTLSRIGLAPSSEVKNLAAKVDGMRARDARKKGQSAGAPYSMGRFAYEANQALTGSAKWDTLDKMENDPAIKAVLRTNTMPLLNAEWEVQPASEDDRDVEIAEFVGANYLNQSNDRFGREYWCSTSWKTRLSEKLQMLRDGFSLTTYTLRRVNAKMVYDTIKWLEPKSVDPYGWEMDESDNIITIQRTYQDPQNRYKFRDPIAADLLNLCVWDLKGSRYEGRQMIRSMYGAWMRKDFIQRNGSIWSQKAGAPMPIGHYPPGWDDDVIDRFRETVESARGESPAEGHGWFPMGSDGQQAVIEFLGADNDLNRAMTDLVNQENAEIARAGSTGSQNLGETATGSRAVGAVQSQREMLMVESVAAILCDQINWGVANLPGEIERLVNLNYAGVDKYPELVCSKIDPSEGMRDMDTLIKSKQAGLIPSHESVRRQVTERFGLNLPDEAYEVEEPPPMVPFPPGQSPPGQPSDDEPVDDPDDENDDQAAAASLSARDDFRARIAPLLEPVEEAPRKGGGFRGRNRLELEVVNLAEVERAVRVGERDILTDLRGVHRDMIEELMGRFAKGQITPRNLDGQRRSKYRGEKKAVGVLTVTLTEVGMTGRQHVDDEIGRQS